MRLKGYISAKNIFIMTVGFSGKITQKCRKSCRWMGYIPKNTYLYAKKLPKAAPIGIEV